MTSEVIEGNILIATFMGGRRLVSNDFYTYWGPDGFEHESGEFLKYHTKWSWIMPVCIKIRAHFINLQEKQLYVGKHARAYAELQLSLLSMDKKALHKSAIEYIKLV